MKPSSYALNLLKGMLEIYSPSGREASIASFLKDEMEKLGYRAHIDGVGNVVGTVEGSGRGPNVLLCGHMDTVPGFIPVKEVNGNIYGRGAVDAKSPLAAMIIAGSRYAEKGTGRITLAAVVDEEGLSKGIKYLIETMPQPDYALFGEPGGASSVTIGYKGSISVSVKLKTRTGHTAASWLYDNAVEKGYELWQLLRAQLAKYVVKGSYYKSLTWCLTSVKTITRPGLVPYGSLLNFNLRLPPGLTVEEAVSLVEGVIQDFKRVNPRVKVGFNVLDAVEPVEVKPSSILVRAFQRAVMKKLGVKAILVRKTGTGDMNVAASKWRIPMVTYGPGDPKLDHTPDEHVNLNDYLNSIEVLVEALHTLSGLHGSINPVKA
ncbi:MAG: M20/M25/M40 family metallo-hydrolase [Candidatus Nezhaarchaeales archaeon]